MENSQQNGSEKKVLVVANPELKSQDILALGALLHILKEGKEKVEILTLGKVNEKKAELLPEGVDAVNELAGQKFLIQFVSQEDSVENVQWNQDNKDLNLYITMKQGDFKPEKMKFEALGGNYEKIYALGITSIDQLAPAINDGVRYIFKDTEIVSFGATLKADGAKIKAQENEKFVSTGEEVYKYAKNTGKKISTDAANYILSSILSSTDGFKLSINDAQTFITCAELTKIGADIKQANSLVTKFSEKTTK